ncbi:MAG: DUF1592 domain-containing protein [Polyangiaceae bacterium]|nr:DUF1592 domain-containing protein [Polyangiaceae bacterium]
MEPPPGLERATRRKTSRLHAATVAFACILPFATISCVGVIGDEPPGGIAGSGVETVALRSAFPRLTHDQWENSMRDLLRLSDRPGLSASFTGDPLGGIFDNNESVLAVTPGLWADYQRAAEELAAMVVTDPAKFALIVPADEGQGDAARARTFIEEFGRRAYRRPLTETEITDHLAIFAQGPAVLGGTPFEAGVQIVLQAFLQSPHFVYRVEKSGKARPDGLIPLGGYEIASKLSYLLWNTMPDDALLDAAAAGEFATIEGVRTRAEQMLADPRARAVVTAFHSQLFDWDHYGDLYKDPAVFPNFTADLKADLAEEARLFVDDVIFTQDGGLTELLTSRTTFVNERIAPIYGITGTFTTEFVKTELDPVERSGILTRAGFLAANGTARASDPIHRGVFVNLRMLCAKLPPPPNNIEPLPPGENKTTRELVDAHTGKGTCGSSCHATLINPAGFAFEHYDAIGAYRMTDNSFPVNAADSYPLGGQMVPFANAVEFSKLLAESAEAHRCFSQHWLEFAYGRSATDDDKPLLDRLATASRDGAPTRQLVLDLILADAFLTRRTVEAQ